MIFMNNMEDKIKTLYKLSEQELQTFKPNITNRNIMAELSEKLSDMANTVEELRQEFSRQKQKIILLEERIIRLKTDEGLRQAETMREQTKSLTSQTDKTAEKNQPPVLQPPPDNGNT